MVEHPRVSTWMPVPASVPEYYRSVMRLLARAWPSPARGSLGRLKVAPWIGTALLRKLQRVHRRGNGESSSVRDVTCFVQDNARTDRHSVIAPMSSSRSLRV